MHWMRLRAYYVISQAAEPEDTQDEPLPIHYVIYGSESDHSASEDASGSSVLQPYC